MTTMEEIENVNINAWRHGYKWTISECLRLEREYDLLKLSVPEMAILHKRTINAIMFKLQAEELDTYNNLYFKTYGQDFINDQIDKLNNLCSTEDLDEDLDEDEDEDLDEDLEDLEEDLEDLEEDLENYHDHSDDNDRTFIFEHVKRIHKHVSNLLGYFTKTQSVANAACI